jgi:alpha-L-fucosidase
MRYRLLNIILGLEILIMASNTRATSRETAEVQAEHGQIGNAATTSTLHSSHPDAQWFPDAGLGLFLHWGISSVSAMNISWPMIPGRPLAKVRIKSRDEIDRIVRDMDYQLDGKKPVITPLDYWKMAADFNPGNYQPEVWMKKVKAAGFTYVVLTTKHHEGFALWPSAFGNFSTRNFMNSRDLLKDYVEAARKVGLKVGFYYSGPDWYFDQDYMNFLYFRVRKMNPEFPELGPDLKPRTGKHGVDELKRHQAEYAKLVKGQVEELLAGYGKIDLLWFDGKPPIPGGEKVITQERIRELQPGIVINPRMHGEGDFVTFERTLPGNPELGPSQWGEFCNPWNGAWPYVKQPYKDLNLVLTDLVRCRALGINYLLGIGPMADGNLAPEAYENMEKLGQWMRKNGEAIHATRRLDPKEEASLPAAAKGNVRYLYLVPREAAKAEPLPITFKGLSAKPESVVLLGDGKALDYTYRDGVVTIEAPGDRAGGLLSVIRIAK